MHCYRKPWHSNCPLLPQQKSFYRLTSSAYCCLLLLLEVANASRVCSRLQSLLITISGTFNRPQSLLLPSDLPLPPDLTTSSRTCYDLQHLLPSLESAAASKACYRLQSLLPLELVTHLDTPAFDSIHLDIVRLDRVTSTAQPSLSSLPPQAQSSGKRRRRQS